MTTKTQALLDELGQVLEKKGNANSGNRGHAGRPGQRGGSAPGGIKSMAAGTQFWPNDWSPLVEVVRRGKSYGTPGYFVRSPSAKPGQTAYGEMFIPDKYITKLRIKEQR